MFSMIAIAFVIGILVGGLLVLAWLKGSRRRGYRKWIHDWEKLESYQLGEGNGRTVRGYSNPGDEFLVMIQFTWGGINAKGLLVALEMEFRKRMGIDGVRRIEVMKRRNL